MITWMRRSRRVEGREGREMELGLVRMVEAVSWRVLMVGVAEVEEGGRFRVWMVIGSDEGFSESIDW